MSEAKACWLVQSFECLHCGSKNSYYSDSCHKCRMSGPEIRKEEISSRWGIDCRPQTTDGVMYYCLTVVESLTGNYKDKGLRLRTYSIDPDNPYFSAIVKDQAENGKSPSKNLLPFRLDFYCSMPKIHADYCLLYTSPSPRDS